MGAPVPVGPLDFATLADYLKALASPARLELLHLLREPRLVREIRLSPSVGATGSGRLVSGQAVRKHLAKLEGAGLIRAERVRARGGVAEKHVVDNQMVFALMEELRRVTRVTPTTAVPAGLTRTAQRLSPRGLVRGARLVAVAGPVEGRTFQLDRRTLGQDRGWVVGRKPGLAASLDYDPFVSQEHCELLLRGDRYHLMDLRTNKNGTALNWESLPRGGTAVLESGDLISVGRTNLLFRSS